MPQRLDNLAVAIESRNVCAMTSRRGPHCFDTTKRATEDGKAFRHCKVSIIRIERIDGTVQGHVRDGPRTEEQCSLSVTV